MADTGTAKLFMHGRSQDVRLPKEFRMPGKEVRVRRIGQGVLLEPLERDAQSSPSSTSLNNTTTYRLWKEGGSSRQCRPMMT